MNKPIRDRLASRNDLRPALYARVSTDDQARNGFSIPSQIKMGTELISENEWVTTENIEVFVDDGISGTHENRPQFNKLKESIKNRGINFLIITDTDRISRETYISQNFANMLMKYNVELYVITDPTLDIYTPSGMLQFTIKSAFNTYEVRKTRASAVRGIIQSFEQGNYANPGVPFGYTKNNKKLYINEQEAAVVRLIHDLYIQSDMSVLKVVEYLKINDYKKEGKHFSQGSIKKILTNPVYIGIVRRNDLNRTFNNIAPAIITDEVKEQVFKLLSIRKRIHTRKNKHLFYRRVICKHCNNLCINDTSSKGYRYYLCSMCGKRFSEVKLDEQIADALSLKLLENENQSKADIAKKKFKEYQKREQAISDLYNGNLISKQSYKYEKKRISQERRVYLQGISSDIQADINWHTFAIQKKKMISSKLILDIKVSMIDKIVIDYTLRKNK